MSTAVDVNIYASSTKDAWPLVGNHENTEVGAFLAEYLDVDVRNVTKQLLQLSTAWLGDPLGADVRVDQLDTYHGEFKRGPAEEWDFVDSIGSCGCGRH